MAKNKGTNYFYTTRTLLERKSPELYQKFLFQLTDEEKKFHKTALPASWLDADMVSKILAKAGKLLYPDMKNPLRECGRQEAREHLSGLYKILLSFASVEMIVKQTAKIWNQYHDSGIIQTVKLGAKTMCLSVTEYPSLTPELRDIVAGYCQGTIELTGAKNVQVLIKGNPQEWQFEITWQ
jgi:hypothetical protein